MKNTLNMGNKKTAAVHKTEILLLSLFAALSFTACSKKTQEDFIPRLPADTEGSVHITGSFQNFESLEAVFNGFNSYYPEVELTYTCLDNYAESLNELLSTSTDTDLYMASLWHWDYERYSQIQNSAYDFSDGKTVDLSVFKSSALHYRNGKLYLLPVFANSTGMLVNSTILEENSLSVPRNYSEFVEVCTELQKKGYENPVMGYEKKPGDFYDLLIQGNLNRRLNENPSEMAALLSLEENSGEIIREDLEKLKAFVDSGFIDRKKDLEITDNYNSTLLRFLKGDVPFMICTANTFSGAKKRESRSPEFTEHPFKYCFTPIPFSEEGANTLFLPSTFFCMNRNSSSVEITSEFLRYMFSEKNLNQMAQDKGLLSVTKKSTDSRFASFFNLPEESFVYRSDDFTDSMNILIRNAFFWAGTGLKSVDQVVKEFPVLEQYSPE